MKYVTLLASALMLGTAGAANVAGSQTTPLSLKVNNFCQIANTGGRTSDSFNKTYATLNLGTINAITSSTVPSTLVAGVDCNYKTALNIKTPKKVTLTNGTDTVDVTTDAWDAQHPLTMAFTNGSYTNDFGYGKYQYYNISASFKVGGSATLANRAWSIPGGTYTGNLVVSYDYNE